MATTAYGVNHPLAVKVWAKKLFVEALKATKFNRFVGTTASSVVQRRTELSKGPGDRITIGLRVQMTGAGVMGDNVLEGNEEALTTYSDNVFIDQLRHASRTAGKMTQQRVPFDIREENMEALRDWWADRMDAAFFNQAGGATVQAVGPNYTQVTVSGTNQVAYTGNQIAIAPSTNNSIICGSLARTNSDTTEGSLSATTTNNLDLRDIDRLVAKAKTLSPMIRPIKVNGEDKYVLFIHPYQTYALRGGTSTGQFVDIQKAAMTGGQVSNNPLYTGALGEYNGVILHEDVRVPPVQAAGGSGITTTSTNAYRAVFCGAQALAFCVGQDNQDAAMNWVEELFDYGNQIGIEAGMIFGLKKMVFNSQDFATITASSYCPSP